MMKLKGSLLAIVLCFILAFGIDACGDGKHKAEITNKIQNEQKAQIISIEEKSKYFDDTPFHWNSKYARIYKVIYKKDGIEIIGWVRFNTFVDDWIMNEKDK